MLKRGLNMRKDRKMKNAMWIALLLVLLCTVVTEGDIITIDVEGIIDLIRTGGGIELDGSVSLGTLMNGSCSYDTETADLYPDNEAHGLYILESISMNTGNYTFSSLPSESSYFGVSIPPLDAKCGIGGPNVQFSGSILKDGSEKTFDEIGWGYSGITLLSFSDHAGYITTDALPVSPEEIMKVDWDRFLVRFFEDGTEDYFLISGYTTSVEAIPEPASFCLLGLAGLLGLRRRFGTGLKGFC